MTTPIYGFYQAMQEARRQSVDLMRQQLSNQKLPGNPIPPSAIDQARSMGCIPYEPQEKWMPQLTADQKQSLERINETHRIRNEQDHIWDMLVLAARASRYG